MYSAGCRKGGEAKGKGVMAVPAENMGGGGERKRKERGEMKLNFLILLINT